MVWPNPDLGTDSVSEAIRAFREKNKNSKILCKKLRTSDIFTTIIKF